MESKSALPEPQLAVSASRTLCKLLVRNDLERVRQWLEISPELVNARHPLGWALLHTAILNCDAAFLTFILSLPKLDITAKDKSDFNSASSDDDILSRKEELCPHIMGSEQTTGASALHFACMRGDATIIALLVGLETNVCRIGYDALDAKNRVPMEYFNLEKADMEAVRVYQSANVRWGALWRSLAKKDITTLCDAICKRDAEYCKEIIVEDKMLVTGSYRTPLKRILSILKSLIPSSMELDTIIIPTDPWYSRESTALHLACVVGDTRIIGLLLQAGADWEKKDDNKMLPEDYVKVKGDACMEGFRRLCEEARERKAQIELDAKDEVHEQLAILVYAGELAEYLNLEREEELKGLSEEQAKKRAERLSKVQKHGTKADRRKAAKEKKGDERNKLAEDKRRMRHLEIEKVIGANVVGQRGPIRSVASAIRLRENGWVDPERPLVMLFLGSSGIGKTEIAKRIALYLHKDSEKGGKDKSTSGDSDSDDGSEDGNAGKEKKELTLRDIEKSGTFVRIDMSEYQHDHTVSNLTGSPKGYVGYNEGGILTNKLRENPKAVVLFDEIEKAHPDVLTVFLQLFDDARITDPKYGTIHCPNAIFIMTSNLGSEEIRQASPSLHRLIERTEAVDKHTQYLRGISEFNRTLYPALKKSLKRDEFLGRINQMVVFLPFTGNEIEQIVRIELEKWKKRALEEHDIWLSWTPEVIARLAQGYDVNYGARSVANEVKSCAIQVIAESQIRGDIKKSWHVRLVINEAGSIDIRREEAQVAGPVNDIVASTEEVSEGGRGPDTQLPAT